MGTFFFCQLKKKRKKNFLSWELEEDVEILQSLIFYGGDLLQ